jgi:aspartyl-tRNA(Asn)/glutamyl-tRNA(Gln) amidotransferase subunit A
VSHPADLTLAEAARLLAARGLSAVELVEATLSRIHERDGRHSHDGDPGSINAWVRVYEDDARAAAQEADARLAAGGAPPLCGIPVGLKDLFAVAGKPLTASSRLLDEVPERSCDAWLHLQRAGAVLVGHLHTHEFAAGGTTDQVGNPWALDRSAGGSSGGSAAAVAARMTAAATGTDTAGSLRIPSALSGTSTIKPTRGLVSLRGVVPLAPSLDHAGPICRTVEDCALLLTVLARSDAVPPLAARTLAGARLAVSPRIGDLDPDVADGFEAAVAACRSLGAVVVEAPPALAVDVTGDYTRVFDAELLTFHRRFDGRRELYRPSIREFVELAEQEPAPAEEVDAARRRRRHLTETWSEWLAGEDVDAVLEPTVKVVAPLRGSGYDHARSDLDLIELTHFWNWLGLPVVALPAGVGARTGLPVGVSLIGGAGRDRHLLALGAALQAELGVPGPPQTSSSPT